MLLRIPAKFKINSFTMYNHGEVSEVTQDCYLNTSVISAIIPRLSETTTGVFQITGVDIWLGSSYIQVYGYNDELYRELVEFLG